jgi:hypothetical protein
MLDDEWQVIVDAQQKPEITQDAPPFNKDTRGKGAGHSGAALASGGLSPLWDLQPVTSVAKISR